MVSHYLTEASTSAPSSFIHPLTDFFLWLFELCHVIAVVVVENQHFIPACGSFKNMEQGIRLLTRLESSSPMGVRSPAPTWSVSIDEQTSLIDSQVQSSQRDEPSNKEALIQGKCSNVCWLLLREDPCWVCWCKGDLSENSSPPWTGSWSLGHHLLFRPPDSVDGGRGLGKSFPWIVRNVVIRDTNSRWITC